MKPSTAKVALRLVQWAVVVAIFVWLARDIRRNSAFETLWQGPKQWPLLLAAIGATLLAVTVLIVRWHVLVHALGLPLTLRDTLRLGFLGYLLNFVSLGAVGGDFFKAIFVARKAHGHRPEAVATVVVDRLIGLYGVFLLGAGAIVVTGAWQAETDRTLHVLYRATFIVTAIMTLLFHGILLPTSFWRRMEQVAARAPKFGPLLLRLLKATQLYRQRFALLWLAVLMTLAGQALLCVAFYWISAGLLAEHPSLAAHFVIVPLATVAGVLPLPMNGLGAMEAVVDFLYQHAPLAIDGAVAATPGGVGALVSLGNRIVQLLVAVVGMLVYVTSRAEMAGVIEQAHQEEAEGHTLLEAEDELPA